MAIRFPALSFDLGPYRNHFESVYEDIAQAETIRRIWRKDHTIWSKNPSSIADRLGWLDCPHKMVPALDELVDFTQDVQKAGLHSALLLGMGGSSLTANVFRSCFKITPACLDLTVVDTTNPDTISALTQQLDFEKTLFIVATKSGSTVETRSLQKHFYQHATKIIGPSEVGDHFVAITDPGSSLADLAVHLSFRRIFLNDPNIGGRYSALSFFGLLPAALLGVDIRRLMEGAAIMARHTAESSKKQENLNSAAKLGAVMAEMSKIGRDKLTLYTSEGLAAFCPWVEQLVAESTGKKGQGILPVIGAPEMSLKKIITQPLDDRLFVFLRLNNDPAFDTAISDLKQKRQPLIQLDLKNVYDLGAEFFRWEFATAVAGALLNINPFDQPNVEAAKVSARSLIAAYQKNGTLPEQTPDFEADGISVFGLKSDPATAINTFVTTNTNTAVKAKRSYIAIQAYLKETTETDELLARLQAAIAQKFELAVTLGYGPRFLHSTGQLHKGDGGQGLFIQLTADVKIDLPIPPAEAKVAVPVTFGVLFKAQASGDYSAMQEAGRNVLRIHLSDDPNSSLKQLIESI
jgi:glucose-6-phosphate isomerase